MGTWQTHKYGLQVVMKAHNVKQNDVGALHGHQLHCGMNLTLSCIICEELISV